MSKDGPCMNEKHKHPILSPETVRKLVRTVILIAAAIGSLFQWLQHTRTSDLELRVKQDEAVISYLLKNCQAPSTQSTSKTSARLDGSQVSISPPMRLLPLPTSPKEVIEALC